MLWLCWPIIHCSPLCFTLNSVTLLSCRFRTGQRRTVWTSWVWSCSRWFSVWLWGNWEKRERSSSDSLTPSTRPRWCWCPGSCGQYDCPAPFTFTAFEYVCRSSDVRQMYIFSTRYVEQRKLMMWNWFHYSYLFSSRPLTQAWFLFVS